MIQKKRAAITQMSILFVLQWLSIATIVLNALAFSSAKSSHQGLIVASEFGPQDYTLLIIGAMSLLASSLLLITYIHTFLRLLGDRPLMLSKKILAFEIGIALAIIASWSTASGIIVTRFNALSICKQQRHVYRSAAHNNSRACSLTNAMFVVGFVAIVVWFVTLVVSVYSLYALNHFSVGGLFSLQAPVHPFEDVKVKINRVGDSQAYKDNPALDGTIRKYESVVTTVELQKAVPPHEGEKREIQRQQEKGSSKIIVIEDLQQNQLQELKPVKTMRSWNFDFSFEPVQLDLMLPSKSELIGSKKKKISNLLYPS